VRVEVVLALAWLAEAGGVARAGESKSDPVASADHADPIAQAKAEEANLESTAPRQGVTFSAAVGVGLLVAKGSVGEMGAASVRLGHVMTPSSLLTLELTGGALPHKQGSMAKTLVDSTGSALAGAQVYTNPSVWIRAAAGVNVHTVNNGTLGTTTAVGGAGAFGAGVDLVRRHFVVLGLEVLGIAAVDRNGLLLTGGLSLGISHY
jgi:hypothetical protein